MTPQCGCCVYWTRDENNKGVGFCRRYPPLPLPAGPARQVQEGVWQTPISTFFPQTGEIGWCGEFSEMPAGLVS